VKYSFEVTGPPIQHLVIFPQCSIPGHKAAFKFHFQESDCAPYPTFKQKIHLFPFFPAPATSQSAKHCLSRARLFGKMLQL
jgi:hypothetical protein